MEPTKTGDLEGTSTMGSDMTAVSSATEKTVSKKERSSKAK